MFLRLNSLDVPPQVAFEHSMYTLCIRRVCAYKIILCEIRVLCETSNAEWADLIFADTEFIVLEPVFWTTIVQLSGGWCGRANSPRSAQLGLWIGMGEVWLSRIVQDWRELNFKENGNSDSGMMNDI